MTASTILEGTDVGQRFHRQWVFRDVNFKLSSGDRLLVTGPNGSGKSTLFKILAGQTTPTRGSVEYRLKGAILDPGEWFRHVSWSGPYMDLYPELSLKEAFKVHFSFRTPIIPQKDMLDCLCLSGYQHKELRHFSSGMLHRVKVGLALFSKSEILLLDEATTNMDEENSRLIWDLTREFQQDRVLVWASNRTTEFNWFEMRLDLQNQGIPTSE